MHTPGLLGTFLPDRLIHLGPVDVLGVGEGRQSDRGEAGQKSVARFIIILLQAGRQLMSMI